jgi:hypothetical protein
MPTISIPDTVMTFSIMTGPFRTEKNEHVDHWEAVLFVMGNPVLKRTYIDRYDADRHPEIVAEYDDTASNEEDAEEKFGVEVAEMFKKVFVASLAPSVSDPS